MSKANRLEKLALCTLIILLILFLISIISAILGNAIVSVAGMLGYVVSAIYFSSCIYDGKKMLRAFLIVELVQLVPCGLIFVMQRLI